MKKFGLGIMILLFLMSCSQHKKTDASNPFKWVIRAVTKVGDI